MLTKAEKALWVKTLREGKFPNGAPCEQARNVLDNNHGHYCCLGVACALFMPPYSRRVNANGGVYYGINEYEEEKLYLPTSLQQKMGLDPSGSFSSRAFEGLPVLASFTSVEGDVVEAGTLASANDNGVGFDKIADFIEKHLKTGD